MRNKAGFVLVETIFVIAVLATSLVLIYSAFSNVVGNQKSRLYYDHTTYIYRTYYILDFLSNQGLKTYADSVLVSKGGKRVLSHQIQCANKTGSVKSIFKFGSLENQACQNIFANISESQLRYCVDRGAPIENCERLGVNTNEDNGIPAVYIMDYNVDPIIECHQNGIDNCNADETSFEAINPRIFPYLKSLSGQTSEDKEYRLVIEYKTLIYEGKDKNGVDVYNTYYYYSSLGF